MKKTLIALAAVAAATGAMAQSTVTISGVVDMAYRMDNAQDNTKDKNSVMGTGATATTAIVISGKEDLGGGMSAGFRYEMNPDFVAGNGLAGPVTSNANGYHFISLDGSFGSVKLGRLNGATLAANGVGTPFGTALGSGYAAGYFAPAAAGTAATAHTAPTRFNGAVEYSSPNVNGFAGRILFVPKNNKAAASDTTPGVTDIGVSYSTKGLNVAFSALNISAGDQGVSAAKNAYNQALTANQKIKQNTLSANYSVNDALTVYGTYWTAKLGTTFNDSGTRVGVKYTMGNIALMASYMKVNDKTTADADGKLWGLGADYALSKRTALTARYQSADASNKSSTDRVNTLALGVRHSF